MFLPKMFIVYFLNLNPQFHSNPHKILKKYIQLAFITVAYALFEKCWQISLYVTDDAIEKLYVT